MKTAEFQLLQQQINHLHELAASSLQMNTILLGFIIDKGVLSPQEAHDRLLEHLNLTPEDRKQSAKANFLKAIYGLAKHEIEKGQSETKQDGDETRPAWFRGVVDGGLSDDDEPPNQSP